MLAIIINMDFIGKVFLYISLAKRKINTSLVKKYEIKCQMQTYGHSEWNLRYSTIIIFSSIQIHFLLVWKYFSKGFLYKTVFIQEHTYTHSRKITYDFSSFCIKIEKEKYRLNQLFYIYGRTTTHTLTQTYFFLFISCIILYKHVVCIVL